MMRGVKGRPDLRLVKGTERPDRAPLITALTPVDPSEVKRPTFVKGRAKRVWDTYAPGRIAEGFLRPEDAHLFGQLCLVLAKYEEAPGLMKAADLSEMRKRAEAFGMVGPHSRARFKNGGGAQNKDPAAKYLS